MAPPQPKPTKIMGLTIPQLFILIIIVAMIFLYRNPDKAPAWYPEMLTIKNKKQKNKSDASIEVGGMPDPIFI
mgnify:CR=1 FL=1